jgi:serine/threonine protein kinase
LQCTDTHTLSHPQALLGLSYIHSRKVIHRDIKSLNLFLDAADNIKVSCCGAASQVGTCHATVLLWTIHGRACTPMPIQDVCILHCHGVFVCVVCESACETQLGMLSVAVLGLLPVLL